MIRIRRLILDRMEELSPSERKVARALLADYPGIGLGSTAALAQAAGTSAPTVLRLVSRLGIGSFPQFQQHLKDELRHDLNSPAKRVEDVAQDGGYPDIDRSFAERSDLMDRLGATISRSEIERAAQLLAGEPKAVLICGGYFSRFIAEILARQIDPIIPNVDFLADPLGYNIGRFYGARRNTVVVIFDLRRYELQAVQVAALAKREGASLIAVTDEGLSPICDKADVVLTAPVGGMPFDSFVPLLTLVEILVAALLRAVGQKGIDRMKFWEQRSHLERSNQHTRDE